MKGITITMSAKRERPAEHLQEDGLVGRVGEHHGFPLDGEVLPDADEQKQQEEPDPDGEGVGDEAVGERRRPAKGGEAQDERARREDHERLDEGEHDHRRDGEVDELDRRRGHEHRRERVPVARVEQLEPGDRVEVALADVGADLGTGREDVAGAHRRPDSRPLPGGHEPVDDGDEPELEAREQREHEAEPAELDHEGG